MLRPSLVAAKPAAAGLPLDIVPGAVVAYGQRALSAAKRGAALYTIRRSSDNTTHTYNSDPTTGDAPAAAISAFIGAGSGFVATWKDQSGNGSDAVQATAATQPQWLASQSPANARPGIVFAPTFGSNLNGLSTAGNVTLANGALTVFAVCSATSFPNSTAGQIFDATTSGVDPVYAQVYILDAHTVTLDQESPGINEAGGNWTTTADLTVVNLIDAAWQFGSGDVKVNGVAATNSASFDNTGAVQSIVKPLVIGVADFSDPSTVAQLTGAILELLIYPSILSDANRSVIRQNIAAYYGITLYPGPLDIVPGAVVAYGQRALSAAQRGAALYTIRRDSDNTTHTYNSDATTGDAPAAAISSFIGAGSGFITTWNDQSGNGSDAVQATAANQPQWLAAAANSHPGIAFTPSAPTFLGTAGNVDWLADATAFFVFFLNTNGAVWFGENWEDIAGPNGPDLLISASSDSLQVIAEPTGFVPAYQFVKTAAGTVTEGAYHLIDFTAGKTHGSIVLDGTNVTLDTSTLADVGTISFQLGVGNPDVFATGQPSDGQIIEFLVFDGDLSDANRLAIRQNIAAYYGITLS